MPADPSAILSSVTELPVTSGDLRSFLRFISLICKTEIIILAFLPNELFSQWVTRVIKMRGENYLSSNSASWKTASQGIYLTRFLSSKTTAAGGEM